MKVNIEKQPDALWEAANALESWCSWRNRYPDLPAGEWAAIPLVEDPSDFRLTEAEFAGEYDDMIRFHRHFREAAIPALERLSPEWIRFVSMQAPGAPEHESGIGVYAVVSLLEAGEPEKWTGSDFRDAIWQGMTVNWFTREPDTEAPGAHTMEKVVADMQNLELTDADRMVLLQAYVHAETYVKELAACFAEATEKFAKYFPLVQARWEQVRQEVEENPERLLHFVRGMMDPDIGKAQGCTDILIDVFAKGRLNVYVLPDRQPRVTVGILFLPLVEAQREEVKEEAWTQKRCKALGDPTRFEMMKLIAEGPKYVQQLADALDIKPATVSKHISHLATSMLITIRLEGRRSYCVLNEAGIRELSDSLLRLIPKKE